MAGAACRAPRDRVKSRPAGKTYDVAYVVFEGEEPDVKMIPKSLNCSRRIGLDQESFHFPVSPGDHI
eukprot:gene10492-6789_t